MKYLFLILVFSVNSFAADTFKLDSSVKDAGSTPFLTYAGPGKYDNYLVLNLPFKPVAELFRQLLVSERRPLTNRGEAHITVLTPVEYWDILRPLRIAISEIDDIARAHSIQNSKFKVVCLGRGEAVVEEKTEATFYVVVTSKDLIAIRQTIQALVIAKGGSASAFDPYKYHPHITLGFTKRDLHEDDKVIKNHRSCVADIQTANFR